MNIRYYTLIASILTSACGPGSTDPMRGTATKSAAITAQATRAAQAPLASPASGAYKDYVPAAGRRLIHPSCRHEVPSGARVDGKGDVWVNGQKTHYVGCDYEPYTFERPGLTKEPGGTVSSGWMMYTLATSNTFLTQMSSSWTVPPMPTHSEPGGSIILFSSFTTTENSNNMIIQPVLRWNAGDSSWHMYAETYINAAGGCSQQDFTSTSVAVNVGDAIQGTLSLITNYEGADNAFVYSIIISDTTQGTESHMLAVNQDCNGLEPFQAAEGGVMEVYNVSECDDLPGSAVLFNSQSWSESTTSDPVYFTQNNFPQRAFNPSWDNRLPDGQQPFAGCTLSVSSSATGTSLSY